MEPLNYCSYILDKKGVLTVDSVSNSEGNTAKKQLVDASNFPADSLLIVIYNYGQYQEHLGTKISKLLDAHYKCYGVFNGYFVNIKYDYKIYLHSSCNLYIELNPFSESGEIDTKDYTIDQMKTRIKDDGPCIVNYSNVNPLNDEELNTQFNHVPILSLTSRKTTFYIMNVKETMTKKAMKME